MRERSSKARVKVAFAAARDSESAADIRVKIFMCPATFESRSSRYERKI